MKNFKSLMVWQKSMTLAKLTYQIAAKLPPEEKFALGLQIMKASTSIPANIAESAGRTGASQNLFLSYALGSAFELETELLLIKELYQDQMPLAETGLQLLDEVQKMLISYQKKLRSTSGK
ncbi:MAG: four helix bundle protein [Chitinophagales bacterium]